MNNEKLEAIARKSAEKLVVMVVENEEEILKAFTHAAQVAHDKEQEGQGPQKMKVTLNHKIVLDLSENKQSDKLNWTVSHAAELECEIPDPDQMKIPGIGE